MHFLFSLLRIKGLYMFRALLAYPDEALHKRPLVYLVRVSDISSTPTLVATNWQHACNIPSAACSAPPEDEQVMLEACGGS
jgi:hypothetical protein